MLDRAVVREFLEEKLEDWDITVPRRISRDVLVETFCRYVEHDLYEWLNDNSKHFFNHGNPEWDWIRDRIKHYAWK